MFADQNFWMHFHSGQIQCLEKIGGGGNLEKKGSHTAERYGTPLLPPTKAKTRETEACHDDPGRIWTHILMNHPSEHKPNALLGYNPSPLKYW